MPYEITSNFMPVISHPASITPRVVLFRHCMIETKDAPQIACPSIIHYIQIRERLDAQDDRSTHVSAEGHELRSKSAGEIAIAVIVDTQGQCC